MLTVENLVTYRGRIQVLHGVDLTIDKGEIVSIIGANGAGKSTLLGSIAGLYKCADGKVTLFGEHIESLPAHKVVRKGLVLIPEKRQIFPNLTVRENLLLGLYSKYRQEKNQIPEKVSDVLAFFPALEKHLHQLGGKLSGGEQQMLAIGRGIISDPKVVLLDEPSMGLSPLIIRDILNILDVIRTSIGTSIILVEQNVKAALKVSDRVYIMERGKLVSQGRPEQLQDNPLVQAAYLGKKKEQHVTSKG